MSVVSVAPNFVSSLLVPVKVHRCTVQGCRNVFDPASHRGTVCPSCQEHSQNVFRNWKQKSLPCTRCMVPTFSIQPDPHGTILCQPCASQVSVASSRPRTADRILTPMAVPEMPKMVQTTPVYTGPVHPGGIHSQVPQRRSSAQDDSGRKPPRKKAKMYSQSFPRIVPPSLQTQHQVQPPVPPQHTPQPVAPTFTFAPPAADATIQRMVVPHFTPLGEYIAPHLIVHEDVTRSKYPDLFPPRNAMSNASTMISRLPPSMPPQEAPAPPQQAPIPPQQLAAAPVPLHTAAPVPIPDLDQLSSLGSRLLVRLCTADGCTNILSRNWLSPLCSRCFLKNPIKSPLHIQHHITIDPVISQGRRISDSATVSPLATSLSGDEVSRMNSGGRLQWDGKDRRVVSLPNTPRTGSPTPGITGIGRKVLGSKAARARTDASVFSILDLPAVGWSNGTEKKQLSLVRVSVPTPPEQPSSEQTNGTERKQSLLVSVSAPKTVTVQGQSSSGQANGFASSEGAAQTHHPQLTFSTPSAVTATSVAAQNANSVSPPPASPLHNPSSSLSRPEDTLPPTTSTPSCSDVVASNPSVEVTSDHISSDKDVIPPATTVASSSVQKTDVILTQEKQDIPPVEMPSTSETSSIVDHSQQLLDTFPVETNSLRSSATRSPSVLSLVQSQTPAAACALPEPVPTSTSLPAEASPDDSSVPTLNTGSTQVFNIPNMSVPATQMPAEPISPTLPKKLPHVILRLPSSANLSMSNADLSSNTSLGSFSLPRKLPRVILKLPSLSKDLSQDSDEEFDSSSDTSSSSQTPRRRRPRLDWDSDLSDLTPLEDSADEGETEVDSEADVPLSSQFKPKPVSSPGSRLSHCAFRRKKCSNLMAPDDIRKTCKTCGIRDRVRDCARRGKMRMEYKIASLKLPTDSSYRLCRIKHCGNVIPPREDYKWKLCLSCRVTASDRARERKLKSLPSDLSTTHTDVAPPTASGAVTATDNTSTTMEVTRQPFATQLELPDALPPYQNFDFLLKAFHARLSGFLQAQMTYLQFKLSQASDPSSDPRVDPVFFKFDAEFSVVADPMGGDMSEPIETVRQVFMTIIGVEFKSGRIFSSPDGAVMGRSACILELAIPVPSPPDALTLSDIINTEQLEEDNPGTTGEAANGDKPATEHGHSAIAKDSGGSMLRRLVGELEVSVSWDRRHRYFPGLRTVIRFRLVG